MNRFLDDLLQVWPMRPVVGQTDPVPTKAVPVEYLAQYLRSSCGERYGASFRGRQLATAATLNGLTVLGGTGEQVIVHRDLLAAIAADQTPPDPPDRSEPPDEELDELLHDFTGDPYPRSRWRRWRRAVINKVFGSPDQYYAFFGPLVFVAVAAFLVGRELPPTLASAATVVAGVAYASAVYFNKPWYTMASRFVALMGFTGALVVG